MFWGPNTGALPISSPTNHRANGIPTTAPNAHTNDIALDSGTELIVPTRSRDADVRSSTTRALARSDQKLGSAAPSAKPVGPHCRYRDAARILQRAPTWAKHKPISSEYRFRHDPRADTGADVLAIGCCKRGFYRITASWSD